MKIVTSTSGGCTLSQEAFDRYNELCREQGLEDQMLEDVYDMRTDEKNFCFDALFVRVVEELGERTLMSGNGFVIFEFDDEYYEADLWTMRRINDTILFEVNKRAIDLWEELKAVRCERDVLQGQLDVVSSLEPVAKKHKK